MHFCVFFLLVVPHLLVKKLYLYSYVPLQRTLVIDVYFNSCNIDFYFVDYYDTGKQIKIFPGKKG